MHLDADRCYRAVESRDARFDGQFVTAVRTTGVYCRPSCPAITPKRTNVEFLPTAAAAIRAGYRACRRCRPDSVPGSPDWDARADTAARAMRLIADGVVERDGVAGLATRLGYSPRQLQRVLTAELGAGPLALARAQRAHNARLLIETTPLPLADVAFAAGFASVRQFNDTMRATYGLPPSALRGAGRGRSQAGTINLRLPYRRPFDLDGQLDFLAARAVPGVELVDGRSYARSLALPRGPATVALHPDPGGAHIAATLRLTELRDLGTAVARVRRLLDLDADPVAVDGVLGADPALAGAVRDTQGIRVPGTVDGAETLLRAMLGQQVTVAAARTAATRLTTALGEPLPDPLRVDGLTRLFPAPAAVAEHGADVLAGPAGRRAALRSAARAVETGDLTLDPGRDAEELRAELIARPGIGPWTAGYLLMRLLGAPDELLVDDAALRRGAAVCGLPAEPDALTAHARRWRPWRSYAGMHLWRAGARLRRTA
jgi:AraC family transcriptional regulator of adaptative response / DNA-3-methyladenine glycosylase II